MQQIPSRHHDYAFTAASKTLSNCFNTKSRFAGPGDSFYDAAMFVLPPLTQRMALPGVERVFARLSNVSAYARLPNNGHKLKPSSEKTSMTHIAPSYEPETSNTRAPNSAPMPPAK